MLGPALAIALALAAGAYPHSRRALQPNLAKGAAAAVPSVVFQFLPTLPSLSGQCTGAALTGTRGETITFTRSGAQTCSKSDGTVVKLTSNQPAVEANGLHVEPAGTNGALQSEAYNNAAWTAQSGITVTADQAVAPDGTTTMDKVVSTNSGNALVSSLSVSVPSGTTFVHSAYVQGNMSLNASCSAGTNASACACVRSDGGSCSTTRLSTFCSAFAATGSTTVRLEARLTCASAVTSVFPSVTAGQLTVSTGTGFVWGSQMESGTFASSYIPTTTTAVARNATNTNLPNLALSGTPSQALTWTSPGAQNLSLLAMTGTGSNDRLETYNVDATSAVGCAYVGTGGTTTLKNHSTVVPVATATRLVCYYDGTNIGICNAGVCQTASATGLTPVTAATTANALGYYRVSASTYSTGWVYNVCLDSTSTGCR